LSKNDWLAPVENPVPPAEAELDPVERNPEILPASEDVSQYRRVHVLFAQRTQRMELEAV
jgi:hypothetical protein